MKKSVILIIGALLIILALFFKSGEIFFIVSFFVITGLASLDVPLVYKNICNLFFKLVCAAIILLFLQILAFLSNLTGSSKDIPEIAEGIYLGPNLLIKILNLISFKISFSLSLGFIGNLLLLIVIYAIYLIVKLFKKSQKRIDNENN